MQHDAFFGDGEKSFFLSDQMITELERLTSQGIGAFYQRVIRMEFHMNDLVEVIRLGLIGADCHPEKAAQLVDTYARNRPIAEVFPLAIDILEARWAGVSAKETAE